MPRHTCALGLALAVLVPLLSACGGENQAAKQEEALEEQRASVELVELDDSGESGAATLRSAGAGATKVVVQMRSAAPEPRPAHIHRGTCEELEPAPAHPLKNVQGAVSETTVDVPLEELAKGGFAINVHKSEKETDTYVACGEIVSEGPL
jgi:hypothetical protein